MAETTGERIKRLREERRWSQETLGGLLNVSKKTIGNWENDRHIPRASLGALEKVFREALVEGDDVERAVRQSALDQFRQTKVIAYYQEQLHEQEREDRLSG